MLKTIGKKIKGGLKNAPVPPENSSPLILAELVIRHAHVHFMRDPIHPEHSEQVSEQCHLGEFEQFNLTLSLPIPDTNHRLFRNSPPTVFRRDSSVEFFDRTGSELSIDSSIARRGRKGIRFNRHWASFAQRNPRKFSGLPSGLAAIRLEARKSA